MVTVMLRTVVTMSIRRFSSMTTLDAKAMDRQILWGSLSEGFLGNHFEKGLCRLTPHTSHQQHHFILIESHKSLHEGQ
jgi:hypothetical protein